MSFNAVGEKFLTDFFGHYGVKGMRWGVRRTDAELGRASGKKKESSGSSGEKKVVGKTKTTGKRAEDLSDAQLQKVLNRMNMEANYARMTAPPPGKLEAATKFMSEIARDVAKKQITAVANAYAADAIGKKLNIPQGGLKQPQKKEDD